MRNLFDRVRGGVIASLGLLAGVAPTDADVIFVRADADGGNNGSSWTDAYVDLAAALDAAQPGDEVWVAAGVYTPADATSSFEMKSSVALYGGFAGSEQARAERDWTAHETILSGDVGRDDTFGPGAWYSNWDRVTANAGHVVEAIGVDGASILDGFTVELGATGPVGTPAGDPLMYGSGIFIHGGAPVVRNALLRHNLAAFAHGGAVYCLDTGASFDNCRFVENYVHLGSGGGLFIGGASQISVTGCSFEGNIAVTSSGGQEGQGAGLGSQSDLPVTVDRCVFEGNIGRAFYACCPTEIARGGGLSSFLGPITVTSCVFRNNQAHDGGGAFVWGDALFAGCLFYGNVANPIDLSGGVSAGASAGALGGLSFQTKTFTASNCTIVANRSGEGAGIGAYGSMVCDIANSIVWGNIATGAEVSPRDKQVKGNITAAFSCVQDLLTAPPGEDPYDPADYPGCIVVDPMLVDAGAGDLHLQAASPCIDTGDNTLVAPGLTADLDGADRIVQGSSASGGPVVDMGAYEFTPGCAADLTGDGGVDVFDLLTYLGQWFGADAAAERTGDATIDVFDLLAYLAQWFAGC